MVKSPLSTEDFPAGFEKRLDANIQQVNERIAAAAARSRSHTAPRRAISALDTRAPA